MKITTIPDRFARNLRAIRERQGYSQEVMASSLQLKRSTYSGYENSLSEPSLDTLHAIQHRYGIGIDVILNTDLYLLKESQWLVLKAECAPRAFDGTTTRNDHHS